MLRRAAKTMFEDLPASLRPQVAGTRTETAARRALQVGLAAVAGFPRLLIYDLAREEAPSPAGETSIFVHGSARWSAYLANRRRFDVGQLTLILALRPLGAEERLLAVDWGTAYANTFLLIEPTTQDLDLTDERNLAARSFFLEAEAVAGGKDRSVLESMLRSVYGLWIYWPDIPATRESCRSLQLPLNDKGATLIAGLQRELPRIFPPSSFQEQLARLLIEEYELFSRRNVERSCSPFLTHLGLPPLYDVSAVTRALRQLVNEGSVRVHEENGAFYFQGPGYPVPDDLPNELLERMLL